MAQTGLKVAMARVEYGQATWPPQHGSSNQHARSRRVVTSSLSVPLATAGVVKLGNDVMPLVATAVVANNIMPLAAAAPLPSAVTAKCTTNHVRPRRRGWLAQGMRLHCLRLEARLP